MVCSMGSSVPLYCAVDPEFAKDQLNLILREFYLHPSGQIPAYEWNFSDVNPPCTLGLLFSFIDFSVRLAAMRTLTF